MRFFEKRVSIGWRVGAESARGSDPMPSARGSLIWASLLAATFLANGCAKVGTLTGGPKDTAPPKIDTLHSSPNRQVNFNKKELRITFDEWVKLDRPSEQVLLSPPLSRKPEITLKGKTVHVKLPDNEQLAPNTTYTLNFGNAVQDFHEGNALAGLRYVFSTGPVIDSLEIKGSVADAFSGQPVSDCTVMLYENTADSTMADSLVKKARPNFFARTDKSGQFSIENLHGGDYRLVAVEDQNLNYRLDAGERVAFWEKNIALPDSTAGPVVLRMFKNESPLRINGNDQKSYGLAKLFFNGPPAGNRPSVENPPQLVDFEEVVDSVFVWYDSVASPFSLIFGKDTVRVRPPDRAAFFKKQALAFIDDVRPAAAKGGAGASRNKFGGGQRGGALTPNPPNPNPQSAKTISQNPRRPLELMFNRPVSAIDTGLVRWEGDGCGGFLRNSC